VPGDSAEDRSAAPSGKQEATADGSRGKQGDDQPGGQTDAPTEHPSDPGGRLVLLDDLYFAISGALHNCCVVRVDEPGFGMEGVDGVVVRQSISDVGVDAAVGEERVECHGGMSSFVSSLKPLELRPLLFPLSSESIWL
jgi:hypothetical protein